APEGSWLPCTPDAAAEPGQAALWLCPTSALSILDAALRLATDHPSPDFAPEAINPSEWPALTEGATALLKKADLAGVPYLSAAALKGWKGDTSPESMSAIVVHSIAPQGKPGPPYGVTAWAEH